MIRPPAAQKAPKIQKISANSWSKGYASNTDPTRADRSSLAIADNVVVDQDGVVRPRSSTVPYGQQPSGTHLGLDEFVQLNGNNKPETYLIASRNISGTGKVLTNKDGGAWTEAGGTNSYDDEAKTRYVQGAGKVLVMNGVDNLSYLDTTTGNIEVFNSMPTPSGLSAAKTGLSGSNITYRYRITAMNTVGETAASSAQSITTDKDRDVWDASSDYVTLSWTPVAGATGYGIYLGTTAGKEVFVTTVDGSASSWVDYGNSPQVYTRLAPAGNSTEGPITTSGANVAGQIYMIGDASDPYRCWFGGSGEDALDFSPFSGGGWLDINLGGKDLPIKVFPFRDGKGTPMATVLMKGTNGTGKLVHLANETQTLGDVIISYMAVYEANGQDGSDSPDGLILYRDSAWYPSADGFKTTGTKPQVQNILSTSNISDTISTDIAKLNRNSMDKASGVAYAGVLYWALPVGTSENNQIWALDLMRGGQWMLPWRISAKQLLLYGDNDGKTHFLCVIGDEIHEFTRGRATEDDGVGFNTKVGSGFIKVSDDALEWMYVKDVTFVLINPQGKINLSVKAKTEDDPIAQLGAKAFNPSVAYAGWGEIKDMSVGWGDKEWGEIVSVPSVYGSSRVARTIEVDDVVNYLQWEVSSTGRGADYSLSNVIIQYVNVGAIITDEMES